MLTISACYLPHRHANDLFSHMQCIRNLMVCEIIDFHSAKAINENMHSLNFALREHHVERQYTIKHRLHGDYLLSYPPRPNMYKEERSCNESRCGRRIVLERWRDLLLRLVVASKTVDARLDQNEAELRVLVFAVSLEVLADGDRLFNEMPEVLRDLGCKTARLQDTKDLVTGNKSHLRDTVRVPEGDTNLGRRKTLASKLRDVLDDILGGRLQPGRGGAAVREGRGRNALSGSVHATHGD